MANDRIYLVCKTCKARTLLAKFYPLPSHVACDVVQLQADPDRLYAELYDARHLNSFLTQHLNGCHPHARGTSLHGDSGMYLETESDLFEEVE